MISKPETADLPTRLRYLAQFQGPPNDGAMTDAAAEIDRLRSFLRKFHNADARSTSGMTKLQDEACLLMRDGL